MTDYMFIMDWDKDQGWHDARIVPQGPIELDPACVTLHYAQETFEGLKAYRTAEGKIQLLPSGNERKTYDQLQRKTLYAGIPGGYVRRSSQSIGKAGSRLGSVRAGHFSLYPSIYVCYRSSTWRAYGFFL